MFRKMFLLLFIAVLFFAFGLTCKTVSENPRSELARLVAENVHLHQIFTHTTDSAKDPFAKIYLLADELCTNIYPAPTNVTECANKLSHGLAKSFDPHTMFSDQSEAKERQDDSKDNFDGIGISITKSHNSAAIIVQDLVAGGISEKYGIIPGDTILSINNVPGSQFQNILDAARAIRGRPGTYVNLEIQHKDKEPPFRVSVMRKNIFRPQIEGSMLTYQGKNYGLIKAHRFEDGFAQEMENQVHRIMRSSHGLSGLIVSVEGNPGGSLYEVDNALDLFMDAESFVLERNRNGIEKVISNPLVHMPGDMTNGIPMLVVVNGRSASASEIFAGALQHNGRALIYGTKTYGKGTIQNIISLADGSEIRVTIAEYLIGTPRDWVPVQCIGVIPDVVRIQKNNSEKLPTECAEEGSISSGGPMSNPPPHNSFALSHPKEFVIGQHMISAFEQYKQMHKKNKID